MLYLMSMYILQDYILFTVLYILLMMGSFIYSTPPHFCCHQAHIFRQGNATSAQPTGGLPAT